MSHRQFLIDSANEMERELAEDRALLSAYECGEQRMSRDGRDITRMLRVCLADGVAALERTIEQFRSAAALATH